MCDPRRAVALVDGEEAGDLVLRYGDSDRLVRQHRVAYPCANFGIGARRREIGQKGFPRQEQDVGDGLGVHGARRAQLNRCDEPVLRPCTPTKRA